eukprot:TRINITY_DN6909_c0_g4_i1.p1 TRINITY_DN6909_c0_g4~~TRINITY_DN6909_c0_g4_i1.p1  ORF type:complete len:124 (+),score=20.28 TRINITY_DN6909_c0_g4_i1:139-510(+)
MTGAGLGIRAVLVRSAGVADVNGRYSARDPKVIPAGFGRTCRQMGWDTPQMWAQLSDGRRPWFEAENESYIYWNRGDGKWWIDGPSGAGVYIVPSNAPVPPGSGWQPLAPEYAPLPSVEALEA